MVERGEWQNGPSNFVSLDFERLPGQQSNPVVCPSRRSRSLLLNPDPSAISDSCSMDITLLRVVVVRFILFSFFFVFFFVSSACCGILLVALASLRSRSLSLSFALLSCSFNDNLCWLVLSLLVPLPPSLCFV